MEIKLSTWIDLYLRLSELERSVIAPPLSGPDLRLLFKLSMKHFLEKLEKGDLHITVKKQKMDTLPMQKQEQILLTFIVEKRTGS